MTRSYLIWFSQRVGSSLLTRALEDTGIAGRPREWLNPQNGDMLAFFGVATAAELKRELWRHARTDNGVLGSKYGMTAHHHRYLTELFGGAWDDFFPSCKHVFMTRRNKIRLAVSWWRAIKSQHWHRPTGEAPRAPDPAELYDRDAIRHLVLEACVREADMQEQLVRWGVVPHTIVYEDFIARYEPTVRGVLEYLEIPGRDGVAIPPPAFEALADEVSDAWVQRFVAEV